MNHLNERVKENIVEPNFSLVLEQSKSVAHTTLFAVKLYLYRWATSYHSSLCMRQHSEQKCSLDPNAKLQNASN